MNKPSMLFLLIAIASIAIALYEALAPISSGVAFVRFMALESFFLVCVSLAIGPIVVLDSKYAPLIEPRRAVGLAAFFAALAHIFLVFDIEFGWQFGIIFSEPHFFAGAAAFVIFIVLAITSSDFAIKLLGNNAWKWVQRMNYIAFLFGFFHFVRSATGLFGQSGGQLFSNYAEIFALAFGIATVLLQIAGFYVRNKREAASKANAAGAQ
jgi:DMSO/TMAO reductase YedYZ heme-binding membrane subunit